MALTILSTLKTVYGFELDIAYGRVAVVNEFDGSKITAALEIFTSGDAFEAGAQPVKVVDVVLNATKPYNYMTDSKDILDLAHDIMIEALAQQGINAGKDL